MYPDVVGGFRDPLALNQLGGAGDGYVLLAKRLHLGTSAVQYSEAVPMEGYNSVFVECTIFAATGAPDPLLKIYVEVSNDRQNWDTLPVGGTAVFVSAATVIYVTLDQATIGEQISAAYVRLKYVTDASTTAVIFSAGVDRRRLGL